MKLSVIFKNCSRPIDVRKQKELEFRDYFLDRYDNFDVLLKSMRYYQNTRDAYCDFARIYRAAKQSATRNLTEKESKNARFELNLTT